MKFTKFCIKLYYLSYKLQFLCVWKQVQEDSLCFGENGLSYHNTILCLFSVPSLSYVCLMNRDWAKIEHPKDFALTKRKCIPITQRPQGKDKHTAQLTAYNFL